MATARVNPVTSSPLYVIRPALAEARLVTEKHARDTRYVSDLSEELRRIESMIVAMEQDLELASAPDEHVCPCAPTDGLTVDWIRTKSGELGSRLRRIEECAPATEDRNSAEDAGSRARLRRCDNSKQGHYKI